MILSNIRTSEKKTDLTRKNELYNDLLDELKGKQLDFPRGTIETEELTFSKYLLKGLIGTTQIYNSQCGLKNRYVSEML